MLAAKGLLLLLVGYLVAMVRAQHQGGEYSNSTVEETPSMDPSVAPTEVYTYYESSEAPSVAPAEESSSLDPSIAPTTVYTYESPSMSPTIVNETVDYNISDITNRSSTSPSAAPSRDDSTKTSSQYTMLTKKAFIIGAFALTALGCSFMVIHFRELCRPKMTRQCEIEASEVSGFSDRWSTMKNETISTKSSNRSAADIESSLEKTTDVTKLLGDSDSIIFNVPDSAQYRTGHSRSSSYTGLLAEDSKLTSSKASSAATTPNNSRKNSVTNLMSFENDLVVPVTSSRKR